ncbi:Cell cycle checkpoint control protein [Nymphaea thermarum]|nr:Cell cycle checkpoint control protein [Nymphaea thermarum]
MEVCIGSSNAIKTMARCITCLARIGNEIVILANPSQLVFHTLNSSRSSYLSVAFKVDFFDKYVLFGTHAQCSVLLKALCAILRTPPTSMDRLSMRLSDSEATKLQCTIDCTNGMKKTYWINCNVQPDIQHLNLDKGKFPSYFVVKPRDFNRLLSNFQASLQEITVIATENLPMTSSTADAVGGKAVELRSYTDPTKENNDASLHTQLWIDPAEEFLQYTHRGDPVDAFLSFCEACEVDTQLFFERAGEPILLAPKFGLEDTPTADFDATLVLATMLLSQLREGNVSEGSPAAPVALGKQDHGNPHEHVPCHASAGEASRRMVVSPNNSQNPSNHTRIWSELSDMAEANGNYLSQRHPSNWIDSVDDEDDDEGEIFFFKQWHS